MLRRYIEMELNYWGDGGDDIGREVNLDGVARQCLSDVKFKQNTEEPRSQLHHFKGQQPKQRKWHMQHSESEKNLQIKETEIGSCMWAENIERITV